MPSFLETADFLRMLLVLLRVGVFGLLVNALLESIVIFCPYSDPDVIFLLLLSFDNELLGLTDLFIEVYNDFVFLLIVKLSNGLTPSLNSFAFIIASPSISILRMMAIINRSSGII
jgi:hypothetical protein